MITEIVECRIKPGSEEKFVAGVAASQPIFERSPGFLGLELHHMIEDPHGFILFIKWESVAHHIEMFQKSPDYAEWRANVGAFFADTPRLQHAEKTLSY